MAIASAKWFRGLLLPSIYVLGVLGIVGSVGGGGSDPCWSFDAPCEPLNYPSFPPNWPYPPPGTPPPSPFVDSVDSIATATDGSDDVYVGGSFTIFKNSMANRIARLNNDGSLDTSFITGTGFDQQVQIIAPAIGVSGDVYVGGYFTTYDGTAVGGIARLNLDGTLDVVFDTGTGFDGEVEVVAPAIDGSGDVYVGGGFTSYNGTDVGRGLVRLNDDGSLDEGFQTGSGWGEFGVALANDGSGDVYATKASSIARLNNDGSIDTGFDTGVSGFNGGVRSIAVATDGDVYASGVFSRYNGMDRNRIARVNSDGSLDAGFFPDPGSPIRGTLFTLATDGSSDIYVKHSYREILIRLNGNGSIDTGFDMGIGGDGDILSAAPVTDGSSDIYVGGTFSLLYIPPDDTETPVDNLARFTSGAAFVR